MVYTKQNWQEMIDAMNSGEQIEINEEVFDYFLGVLPPVFMNQVTMMPNGLPRKIDFAFAEGAEPLTYFWHDTQQSDTRSHSHYFAWRDLSSMNPNA
jgi:hypothetical protein